MPQMLESTNERVAVGIAFGLAAVLIWGTWPVISRLGVQQTMTAFDIVALRFAIAGPLLLPLFWRRGIASVGWPAALLLTCGAGGPYVMVVVGGLVFAPATHFGVITPSAMLIFSTLGGWLLLGDKPSPTRLAGLAVILCGVALIGWQAQPSSGDKAWIGDLMFACGGLFWAGYTVGSRYFKVEPFHATALVAVLSMIGYLPLYLIFADSQILEAPVSEVLFQGIYQGVFVSIVALLFFTRAVAILGAARGGLFGALIPGLTVILSFPVLGEVPTWREMAGVVAVSIGMVVALGVIGRRIQSKAAS